MSYCIFLDIDGTLIKQTKPRNWDDPLLPGAKEFVDKIYKDGGQVIITTSRSDSERKKTETQLRKHGIRYDQLIMDLNDKPRVVINDRGPKGFCRAFAFDLKWNEGLEELLRKFGDA